MLAYSVGLEQIGDRPRLRNPNLALARGEPDASEVGLSSDSAALTQQLAKELVLPKPAPVEPVELPSNPGPGPGPGPQWSTGSAARGSVSACQVALWARVDAGGLFGLNRPLSWLREHFTALDVEVTARVTAGDRSR
jgi:hypothetical protein